MENEKNEYNIRIPITINLVYNGYAKNSKEAIEQAIEYQNIIGQAVFDAIKEFLKERGNQDDVELTEWRGL